MGAATTLFLLWVVSPLPLAIDRPLMENDAPIRSAAIVCLGSGSDHGLPSSSGWQRIRTSVALFRDGYAPVIVFSGNSRTSRRSEAEIYSEAARWIGLPPQAVRLEPLARNTLEQARLLGDEGSGSTRLARSAPLLLVTSPFHARRVRGVFRKAGFTSIRVVTSWRDTDSNHGEEPFASVGARAVSRISWALVAVREWGALAYYRAHGWI